MAKLGCHSSFYSDESTCVLQEEYRMSLQTIGLLYISEIFGVFALKKYATDGGLDLLGYGILGYAGVVFFLIQSLRVGSVMMVNAAWDGISALIESIAAYVILGERLDDPNQYIGIALIVGGLLFLKIPIR
jgi:small multidrug resistance pump